VGFLLKNTHLFLLMNAHLGFYLGFHYRPKMPLVNLSLNQLNLSLNFFTTETW
jgi:hypothetical protein